MIAFKRDESEKYFAQFENGTSKFRIFKLGKIANKITAARGNPTIHKSDKDEKNYKYDIEVDGGINFSNSKDVINAGANILVSGTTIFKENNGNIKKNIETLKEV